jgi:hypothetical protein
MKASTAKAIKDLGLKPSDFSAESVDLTNRTVLVDNGYGANRLFKATGGFVCSPQSRGSCIFATCLASGMSGRIERYDVIAVRTLDADLRAADQKIGAAQHALDQARRHWGKETVFPSDHHTVLTYNEAAKEYEEARAACYKSQEAQEAAGKAAQAAH